MRRRATYAIIAAVAALSLGGIAWACADSGCDSIWNMGLKDRDYCAENMALLAPGNDTRTNMLLLLLDQNAPEQQAHDVAAPVFSWDEMKASYLDPVPVNDNPVYTPAPSARCRSNSAGVAAFTAAVTAERGLSRPERTMLIRAREHITLDCSAPASPDAPAAPDTPAIAIPAVTSPAAQGFAAYLAATRDFYAGNFEAAKRGFTAMSSANNAWLAEARLYMIARADLNAMQVGAFDRYGYRDDRTPVDMSAAQNVENAFNAYLTAYPRGHYAASAKGLLRRVYWFSGQRDTLLREYEWLLARRTTSVAAMIDTSQEVDLKLLGGVVQADINNPIILATVDLARMRSLMPGDEEIFQNPDCCRNPFTRAELEAQRSRFAGNEALFDLLLANYAYHVENNPREVLRLIPDAARETRYTHVQFSRQMLRGLALEALHDRNALGFWGELIGSAGTGHQRQGIELAIALHHERSGSADQVFAADSPVRLPFIRERLILNSAGPALLRRLNADSHVEQRERDMALFTLLYKQLTRGEYAAFVGDVTRAPQATAGEGAPGDVHWSQSINSGFFNGAASDPHFACPRLPETVALLARNRNDVRSRMCLAEFMRINGFDDSPLRGYDWNQSLEDTGRNVPPALGHAPSAYPEGDYSRLNVYRSVIANRAASADDRAYALYRALWCYARSGYNSCGGVEADVAQRGAWFRQLHRDYAGTHWARVQDIYW